MFPNRVGIVFQGRVAGPAETTAIWGGEGTALGNFANSNHKLFATTDRARHDVISQNRNT